MGLFTDRPACVCDLRRFLGPPTLPLESADHVTLLARTSEESSSEISIVATVEQIEENAVSIVWCDPRTNESKMPRATGIFIEEVLGSRIDRTFEGL